MATLHLTEQGGCLRKLAGRLLVEDRDGLEVGSAPAMKVRAVIVHGNARVTTPALQFLLERNATVAYLSTTGRLYGHSAPPGRGGQVALRAQLTAGPDARLAIARGVLRGKLTNARAIVARGLRSRPQLGPPDAELLELRERLDRPAALDGLRGLEGRAARVYFMVLARLLEPYGFTGRNRRPPLDPANAALSYAYAVLQARMTGAVELVGLHPDVGFLHGESRGQPGLVLDLMEEFRAPVCDAVVLNLCVRHAWPPDSFESRDGGVYLTDDGRRTLVSALEERFSSVVTHRRGFRAPYFGQMEFQARLVAHHLRGLDEYEPFTVRG